MMDYYSEMPGPTKEAVKEEFERNLKPVLRNEAAVPDILAHKVNIDNLIDESINEGVDKAYKSYSFSGWNVFGHKECTKAVREIFLNKLRDVKASIKKGNLKKLAFGKDPEHIHEKIASFLGGRRRKKTRRNRMKSSRRKSHKKRTSHKRKSHKRKSHKRKSHKRKSHKRKSHKK